MGYIYYDTGDNRLIRSQCYFYPQIRPSFYQLRPMASIVWAIIQINDQLFNMRMSDFVRIQPLLEAVDNKITGFERNPKDKVIIGS